MSSEAIQDRKIFEVGPGPRGKKHQKSRKSKNDKKNSRLGFDGLKEVTLIEVRNPITYATRLGRSHTDFEVSVKTNCRAFTLPQSVARRRYSDFVWLRNCLAKNDAFSSIRATPRLPPKKILGRFEDSFLQERMKGLQRFLRKVIEHNVYLSDTALHLFLQSDMTVEQIDAYLAGKKVPVDSKSAAVLGEQHQTFLKRLPRAPNPSVSNIVASAASYPSTPSGVASAASLLPIPNAVASAASGPSIPNEVASAVSASSIPNAVASAASASSIPSAVASAVYASSIPNAVASAASASSIPSAVASAASASSIPNAVASAASGPSIPNAVASAASLPSIPNAVAEIATPLPNASQSLTSSGASHYPVESRLPYSGNHRQGGSVRKVSVSSESSAESLGLVIMHMEDREKSRLFDAP